MDSGYCDLRQALPGRDPFGVVQPGRTEAWRSTAETLNRLYKQCVGRRESRPKVGAPEVVPIVLFDSCCHVLPGPCCRCFRIPLQFREILTVLTTLRLAPHTWSPDKVCRSAFRAFAICAWLVLSESSPLLPLFVSLVSPPPPFPLSPLLLLLWVAAFFAVCAGLRAQLA